MKPSKYALFYTMLLLVLMACSTDIGDKEKIKKPNSNTLTEDIVAVNNDTAGVTPKDTLSTDENIQADEADEKIIEAIEEEEVDLTQQTQQKEDAVIFTNVNKNKKEEDKKKQNNQKPKTEISTSTSATTATTTTTTTTTTTNDNTPKGEEIFTSKGGDIQIKKIPKQLNEQYFKKSMTDYNFQLDEPVKITAMKGKANIEIKGTVSGNDLPSSGFVIRVFKNDTRSYERGRHLVRMPLPVMQSKSGGHRFNTSFDLKAAPGTYYYTIEYPRKREILHYGKLEVK